MQPSHFHCVIIGTGFGGLCMAMQLSKAGIQDFTLLEKANGVGGTWRDNTYPGAACDVQSHLYSYSFEPKHDWSRKFGRQKEIQQYMEDCVDKYQFRDHIQFNKEVASARYDEQRAVWVITTTDGNTITANILVSATGQLNQPAYPNIPGVEKFKGTAFHSARWDHSANLTGKKVAVIGTGASAIQFVPEIVSKVKQLKLFQRSAAWVISKPDRPFQQWEQEIFKKAPIVDRIYRSFIYWKNESRAIAFTRFNKILDLFSLEAKALAKKHVKDPEKLAKVIPNYKIGCKRILISNEWYQAMNQDHLDIIDNKIERIDETGVVTQDGTHHNVDAIIYGTGFKATDFLTPMTITGMGGINLNTAWKDGAQAYKGICVSGFPNLFILYGPNTNLAHNSIVFMLESQVQFVMQCLGVLKSKKNTAMNVKAAVQQRYGNAIQERLKDGIWSSGCTSWYITDDGINTVNWPGFTFTYRASTKRPNLNDFEFVRASA